MASSSSSESEQLATSKRLLLALRDAKHQLQAVEQAKTEPLAIVGLGCRFPKSPNPDAFWQLLDQGIDAVTEIPKDRWDIEQYYDPEPGVIGKMYTRYASFITDVDQFDPEFFKISPREAKMLDPQHRLLLELCWESLEDAGISPLTLKGSLTGVFIGMMTHDYGQLATMSADLHTGSGNGAPLAAGRIAYTLGLQGPTLTVETACSSSLVACHLACQSLRRQECNLALVGGVNLMLTPHASLLESLSNMNSPDGRCKTFDESADGYGRGEGCGIVVLKRLSDAQADGDRILAMIRGAAINHDGPSGGLTVPNGLAQQALIQAALADGNVDASEVDYLECHGTGTALGDPIEVDALAKVYGPHRSKGQPLVIGSVKTNIGHTEGAAGIAGLIKVILSLQQEKIPPHLHLRQLNQRIAWAEIPVVVSTESRPWLRGEKPRLAGVSSFGLSGTNAHVIVEEAPPIPVPDRLPDRLDQPWHLLTLSAKTAPALRDLARRYETYLNHHPELAVGNICYTANTGRAHFNERLAIVGASATELSDRLRQFREVPEAVGVSAGSLNYKTPTVAFLFTGQGSQYWGMGRQLYETQSTFRDALEHCADLLRPYLERPLLEVLYASEADTSLLAQTAYTQPALFALEYALYQLWRSWGIQPAAVMGHSVGEYVAACVAGVFSLEDGLKLIATRGKLMQQLPAGGAMVALMASPEQVSAAIADQTAVAIAAVNGPESTVISGSETAIQQVVAQLEAQGVKSKSLQVAHAFHSVLMQPMLAEFEQIARRVSYSPPRTALISNVTGQMTTADVATPEYWCRHILSPVNFEAGMKTLDQQGCNVFLECGPQPILLGMGRQCLPDETGVWLPSLRSGVEDGYQILDSLGQLYVQGVPVDWSGFNRDSAHQKVSLPTYSFQRQRYWIETNGHPPQYGATEKKCHPLLGQRLHFAGQQRLFEARLGESEPFYLRHHRVFEHALFPTTAYLEMAVAAGQHHLKTRQLVVENLAIGRGMLLPTGELKTVQTLLTPTAPQSCQFQIFTQQQRDHQDEPDWILNASGTVRTLSREASQPHLDLAQYQAECRQPIEVEHHYQSCRALGLDYGVCFQGIQQLWRGENRAIAKLELPQALQNQRSDYHLHPVLLDAALQIILYTLPESRDQQTYIPVGIDQFEVYDHSVPPLWACASATHNGDVAELTTQVILVSGDGTVVGSVSGLRVKQATPQVLLGAEPDAMTHWFYEVEWRSQPRWGQLLPPELRSPDGIKAQINADLSALLSQVDIESTEVIQGQLETLSLDYVIQALRKMGWSYQPGDGFSLEAAIAELSIVPNQARLFKRLLQILAEVGIVQEQQQQWQVLQNLQSVNSNHQQQSLLEQFPHEQATITLLHRCASGLSGVLQGTQDPVQLVFPDGDLTTATQLYEESPGARVMNTLVQKVITEAIELLPPSRGLRVLEIGAGTGGTTSYVLPHLTPSRTEYTFTDIGVLFITKAQDKFKEYSFLSYQTLDIETDPVSQGFEVYQYDVIIAANVLHATTDLHQTMGQVRKLLAPGGLLVMLEATARSRSVDLIFGLLEGWWKFSDHALRPDHPLLNRTQWQQLLGETGFTQVVTLPDTDGRPEIFAQQAVIVAQADPAFQQQTAPPKHWLLLADPQGLAQTLSTHLRSQGERCTLVFAGDEFQHVSAQEFILNPQRPAEFEQLIAHVLADDLELQGVVNCWTTNIGSDQTINGQNLAHLSQLGCGSTLFLVQALVQASPSPAPRLWIVTQGSQPVPAPNPVLSGVAQSSVWGLGKVINLEHPELHCVRIDLDPMVNLERQAGELLSEIWSQGPEDQVALRGSDRYVARLVESSLRPVDTEQHLDIPSQPFQLTVSKPGLINSLTLEPTTRMVPQAGEVEIRVWATGLNFRDVLIALDMYPGTPIMGGDCAGDIVAVGPGVTNFKVGDPVIALAGKSFSQYVTVNASYVVPKPDLLSYAEAASIPVNFLTAYYALYHLTQITAGERILIHAAAGGTGMAAVQLAQQAGTEIFATASPSKWDILQQMGIKHIMNSRTVEFADQIMEITQGQGVDIVLNSLTSGDFIRKSLSVVSPQGRFIELAVRSIWDAQQMSEQRPDISYFPVDFSRVAYEHPELAQKMLQTLSDQFAQSRLKAPPLTLFPMTDVIPAFRYMQQAKQVGKIVVTQTESQTDATTGLSLSFRDDASYLITGGLGGLGLLVARWMVEKGVRHLVLVGRRTPEGEARAKVTELEQAGVQIVLETADVSDFAAMAAVVDRINQSNHSLSGIMHAAGLLSDGVLQNQSWASFEQVMAPKVQGAWHLHQLTQNQPLDFFILFSSVASLLGSPGQGNHSAANAFLDGLAHYRQAMGLTGLSIHWGAVSQVGEAAERGADVMALQRGMEVISPTQVLESLERLMGNSARAEVGVVPIEWSAWQERVAQWSFLSDWAEAHAQADWETTTQKNQLLEQLSIGSLSERETLLETHLRHKIAQVLSLEATQIDTQKPLNEMGLDSLMSVELRNQLKTSLGVDIPVTKFLEEIAIAGLVTEIDQQLNPTVPPQSIEPDDPLSLDQVGKDNRERVKGAL